MHARFGLIELYIYNKPTMGRWDKVECDLSFLLLIKVWVSIYSLLSSEVSIKAKGCRKMCDRSILHVSSSVSLLNSCRLPTPCFNCGVYSPHHLTLMRTILNSLSHLYNTYPQCSSCGLRTPDIAMHLDWHFRLGFLHYTFLNLIVYFSQEQQRV